MEPDSSNDLIQHKCCYSGIVSGMVSVDISSKAHPKLQSTPFHHFVGAPALVIISYLLDDICGRYQGNGKFVIGGKELTCTVEDLAGF